MRLGNRLLVTKQRAMGVDLREQIRDATQRLAEAGVPSPRHDAEALATHVLGVGRAELVTAPEALPSSFAAEYAELVHRRATREPLQHITGVAPFRHINLQVGPGVFVPRPETELTAGAAVDEAKALVRDGRVPVVVDLFAGSGAIAISVAHEVHPCVVHAVESEDAACEWLRRNVAGQLDRQADGRAAEAGRSEGRLGGKLVVHHDDAGGVADRSMATLRGTVDVVVANPPYIPTGAVIRDPEVAERDPAAALWSGPDGLDAMRVLESAAARLLRPGGLVVAEHADVQGTSVPAVFTGVGRWTDVADHVDLNGRPRFLTARLA